jgi:hypothetical protein
MQTCGIQYSEHTCAAVTSKIGDCVRSEVNVNDLLFYSSTNTTGCIPSNYSTIPPTRCRCKELLSHLITQSHTTFGTAALDEDCPIGDNSDNTNKTLTRVSHTPGGIRTRNPGN